MGFCWVLHIHIQKYSICIDNSVVMFPSVVHSYFHLGKYLIVANLYSSVCTSLVSEHVDFHYRMSASLFRPTLPIGSEMVGLVRT